MKNTECRRSAIQNAISPVIDAALEGVPGFDFSRDEDQRRLVRALVRVAASKLIPQGVNPTAILVQCAEAIAREVEANGGAKTVTLEPEINVPASLALN